MSDEAVREILAVLTRVEAKLDASSVRFAQHVADDALLAADVRALARKQRGFLSWCGSSRGCHRRGDWLGARENYRAPRLS